MKWLKKEYISPVVAMAFVAVAVTGIMMLFHIRIGGIKAVHEWIGVIFAVAGLLHLILNWKIFLSYLSKPAAVTGLAVVLIIVVLLFVSGGGEGAHHGPPRAPWEQDQAFEDTPAGQPVVTQEAS